MANGYLEMEYLKKIPLQEAKETVKETALGLLNTGKKWREKIDVVIQTELSGEARRIKRTGLCPDDERPS